MPVKTTAKSIKLMEMCTRDKSVIVRSKVLEFFRTKGKNSKDFGTKEIGKDKVLL